MTVFDTWVGNSDRHNAGNLVVSLAWEGSPGVAYIDYGNSLSHGWQAGPAPERPTLVGRYPGNVGSLAIDVVWETVERIEKLSDVVVRAVVKRIPDSFLPTDWGSALADGLLKRRDNLRAVFESACGGKA
jgi:hypothetical protein